MACEIVNTYGTLVAKAPGKATITRSRIIC